MVLLRSHHTIWSLFEKIIQKLSTSVFAIGKQINAHIRKERKELKQRFLFLLILPKRKISVSVKVRWARDRRCQHQRNHHLVPLSVSGQTGHHGVCAPLPVVMVIKQEYEAVQLNTVMDKTSNIRFAITRMLALVEAAPWNGATFNKTSKILVTIVKRNAGFLSIILIIVIMAYLKLWPIKPIVYSFLIGNRNLFTRPIIFPILSMETHHFIYDRRHHVKTFNAVTKTDH